MMSLIRKLLGTWPVTPTEFLQRGLQHEGGGNLVDAIEDYSQTIKKEEYR